MRPGAGGEMSSRGKAHNPYAIRGNPVFPGPRANGADRALCVTQFDRVVILGAETITQHERSHSDRVEPARDVSAFLLHGEVLVSAAGTDNHRRSGALSGGN